MYTHSIFFLVACLHVVDVASQQRAGRNINTEAPPQITPAARGNGNNNNNNNNQAAQTVTRAITPEQEVDAARGNNNNNNNNQAAQTVIVATPAEPEPAAPRTRRGVLAAEGAETTSPKRHAIRLPVASGKKDVVTDESSMLPVAQGFSVSSLKCVMVIVSALVFWGAGKVLPSVVLFQTVASCGHMDKSGDATYLPGLVRMWYLTCSVLKFPWVIIDTVVTAVYVQIVSMFKIAKGANMDSVKQPLGDHVSLTMVSDE